MWLMAFFHAFDAIRHVNDRSRQFTLQHSSLVVEISAMKLVNFYHSGFSDYCLHLYCYFRNVSADMSSCLLLGWISIEQSRYMTWIIEINEFMLFRRESERLWNPFPWLWSPDSSTIRQPDPHFSLGLGE